MAKKTVLEIVQEILNDIDGDEVNSIDDTYESEQIALIVESTFNAMMSNREWSHTRGLFQLVPSGTTAKPTHMTYDEDVKRIIFINYNKASATDTRKKYLKVDWKSPDDFLRILNARDDTASNTDLITDDSGVELVIRNDLAPTYYTTFNDKELIFDSYDKAVDDTLQASKVQSMGYIIPSFTRTDAHVPDLPSEAFTYLIEESKSKAAVKLRQVQDPKAEAESTVQRRWLSRNQWTADDRGFRYPDYGRKGRRIHEPTFRQDK